MTVRPHHKGVLAFGDSITNGGGELQWGVALQSWAQWLARAYGMPYSGYAFDGATARDVVDHQIPAFEARQGGDRFDLGLLYIGVNDVRNGDWDPDSYARDIERAAACLRARSERVLACTIPLDLGRPRAGHKVVQANALIRALPGVTLVALEDFGARNRVMADQVHPTAFGQVAIAERAIRALGEEPKVWPSALIAYDTTRWRRLRSDATYSYRRAKVSAQAAALRAAASARRARSARTGGSAGG